MFLTACQVLAFAPSSAGLTASTSPGSVVIAADLLGLLYPAGVRRDSWNAA